MGQGASLARGCREGGYTGGGAPRPGFYIFSPPPFQNFPHSGFLPAKSSYPTPMPDPSLVAWADGSLHAPAGGQHKETDPDIAQLSGDARLPAEPDDDALIDKRLKLQATTAAKMMRAAHQAQSALNRARLFDCDSLPADPINSRDGVALQILKRLARQVKKLEDAPLAEEETELEREVKIAQILSQMTKQQAVMEQSIAKAVGLSTKAQQEAAKLQFAMRVHKDKMAGGGLDAAEVERIANG